MLEFKDLKQEDVVGLKEWFSRQTTHIGDYSLGFQFMWNDALSPAYAVCGDCLILREIHAGKTYFYYPISRFGDETQVWDAVSAIEAHCRDENVRLHFTNVPRAALPAFALRYGRNVTVTNNRRWRDYLYRAEDFKTYAGGKFAGQRNHVHKFRKLHPDWRFRACTEDDLPAVREFLASYEGAQRGKHEYLADAEMDETYAFLPKMKEYGAVSGVLEADGKIVAFSAGERCGDMLLVHVEKALRGCEGAYPAVAQQFALAFCGDDIKYINRMDDAADGGLRKSKLQYGPCELVDKYNLAPKRAIDETSRLPVLRTARLTLAPLKDADAPAYTRLASDTVRNRYWGYDWREDYAGASPPPDSYFIACAREEFKARREMSLGVYAEGKLAGEVVLHRFGYADEAEIGVRLLPEAEGKGYAREAVRAYAEYAFLKLSLSTVEAKCFKENARSRETLLGAGMRQCGEDGTYFYFRLTPEM